MRAIEWQAFAHNNIAEVDIPKTVQNIGKKAFLRNNQLFKKMISGGNYVMQLDNLKFRVHGKDTRVKDQSE